MRWALSAALPQVPLAWQSPLRFDHRSIAWDSAEIAREGERLFSDPHYRVDLRDLCRTVAPWFKRLRPASEFVSDVIPCDGDQWFRDACGRVLDWLAVPVTYLHKEDVAAHLGPYAALECARQCSPSARYYLSLPEVALVVERFEHEGKVDEEQWRTACLALRTQMAQPDPTGERGASLAYSVVAPLLVGGADLFAITMHAQGRRAREKRE